MLDDLRRPAGKLLPVFLPSGIQVFDLDVLAASGFAYTVQRQTALLRFVRRILLHDHGVVHDHVEEAHVHNDDTLLHADHVGGHPDTAVMICLKSVHKVLTDIHILPCSGIGLLAEEENVFYDGFDHRLISAFLFCSRSFWITMAMTFAAI